MLVGQILYFNMKKRIVLVAVLLLSIIAVAQEKNDGYRFSMAVDLGVQNFLGRSGISMIDYNQNDFSSMRYNCLLGFNNSKRFFALELSLSSIEAKYDNTLRESISIYGLGLLSENKLPVQEKLFINYTIGAGLLASSECIRYNSLDLDSFHRLGAYIKFGIGLGFDVNNLTIGAKEEIVEGYLQSKDLPSQIKLYQTPENRIIFSSITSLFLKIRL